MCASCGCGADSHDDVAGGHEHHDEHDHAHHGDAGGHGHAHDHAHHGHAHDHAHHGHASGHSHGHEHERPERTFEAAILAKNDRIAARARRFFEDRRILALNLVSSPGAGKTTLLERTIADLRSERDIQVIEGDQATSHDADRIRRAGAAAVQINTGTGCYLDADMVDRSLARLDPRPGTIVFIENVGNLVCPALFDLGERAKVLVASVTEGDDKPLKYPHMFRVCQLVLLNKIDLLPYVRFDVERFLRGAKQVNAAVEVVPVSALEGTGLNHWYRWMRYVDVRA